MALAFAAQVGLAITGLPRPVRDWFFAAAETPGDSRVHTIVVFGGGGMPSETSLIRAYWAAQCATQRPDATVVVALPTDGDPETSSVGRLRDELVLRGVLRTAIRMECRGRNTYEQAKGIRQLLGETALQEPVLVVTSPYHMRRCILCLRKQGFARVAARPAQDFSAEADPGLWEPARYAFWARLQLHILLVRELCALAVYKLRGWI